VSTRRQFLRKVTATAAGAVVGGAVAPGCAAEPRDTSQPTSRAAPRVAIARDEALTRGRVGEHGDLLRKLLDAAVQKATDAPDAAAAWRSLFRPADRVGIKVNTLGLSTQPAVVDAIVAGLLGAGLAAEKIIVWDRFDTELAAAGFKLNKSRRGVQCRGTDAEQYGSGYQQDIESSGRIGSCFSKIVAEEVNALICVPVLKDHNLAGVSLGLKNFFGAIHNPNKYHDHNCDPYVADVVSHRFIAPKWRLTVCDGTRAQYNAGPARHPGFAWPFGGLIVSGDFVAADAVAADLLDAQRKVKGLKSLAEDKRPAKHIATAGARGLGVADLSKIERIEV
ncbi:MAG: DUF362 domain-containing protein, partial [Phycisphaerae bacterium]|nr:DUF362 domain-containing protein [Phycisphaerae bacterium]